MRVFSLLMSVALPFLLAQPVLADGLPRGFALHKFNPPNQQPVTRDGVTTFHIDNEVCSKTLYGDGRGESDCKNGNVRSVLIYQPEARMGQERSYRFDIQVDPSFAYAGFEDPNSAGMLPDAWNSDLRIASWEGEFVHNFIYRVSVDKTKGVTFLGRQCQAPEDFGKWVSFRMDVKWSGRDDGWVKVSCNDRVIYAAEALATNQAPHCWPHNQCEPGIAKNPKTMLFILGTVFQGNGTDWKKSKKPGLFNTIQPGGITIRTRNMAVTANPVLYSDEDKKTVRALQHVLNGLGCDVGAEDGIAGRKTREGALYCRVFPAGVLPAVWNVTTAAAFLAAYTGEGVADLPRGQPPAPPDFTVKAAVTRQNSAGDDRQVDSDVDGIVTWKKGKTLVLKIVLTGTYVPSVKLIHPFEIVFQAPLDAATLQKLKACHVQRIDHWGDGSKHLVLRATLDTGPRYLFRGHQCVVDAVPAKLASEITFVLTNFRAIAGSIVSSGAIAVVKHNGLKDLITGVAAGNIVVSAE